MRELTPAMLAAIRSISVLNERCVDYLAVGMLNVSVLLSLCCISVGMNKIWVYCRTIKHAKVVSFKIT